MAFRPLKRELVHPLPQLYETEQQDDPLVFVHLHSPANGWHWYLTEGSDVDEDGYYDTNKPKVDFLFFGLTKGFETELGYVSLNELQGTHGQVWIDVDWSPKPLSEVRASIER